MARYALETHYLGAHYPTVLVFDSKADAETEAGKHISTHTGVARVVIRPLTEADEEEDDNLAGPRGMSIGLHIVGAFVASGWFFFELGRLL